MYELAKHVKIKKKKPFKVILDHTGNLQPAQATCEHVSVFKKVNFEFLLKTTNTVIITTLNYCLGLDPRASGSGLLMVSDAGKNYDSSKSSLKQHFPHSPGQCGSL